MKNFKLYIIENADNSDIDPYKEEDWENDNSYDIEDVEVRYFGEPVITWYVEMVFNDNVVIFTLEYVDGFYSFTIENKDDIPQELIDFIDEHYPELLEKILESKQDK